MMIGCRRLVLLHSTSGKGIKLLVGVSQKWKRTKKKKGKNQKKEKGSKRIRATKEKTNELPLLVLLKGFEYIYTGSRST